MNVYLTSFMHGRLRPKRDRKDAVAREQGVSKGEKMSTSMEETKMLKNQKRWHQMDQQYFGRNYKLGSYNPLVDADETQRFEVSSFNPPPPHGALRSFKGLR